MLDAAHIRSILRLRAHVAWLGDRERCGWWSTDALAPDAGGAILQRIFPRTAAWAAVEIAAACASVVEVRCIPEAPALTLFRLGAAREAELRAWVRGQKQSGSLTGEITPQAAASNAADAKAAVVAAHVVPDAAMNAVVKRTAPPGARAIELGRLDAADLSRDDAVLGVAERLAAAYLHHAGTSDVRVPFFRAS